MNIKQYIDQRKIGSFHVNLSRANRCSVKTFLKLSYNHTEK